MLAVGGEEQRGTGVLISRQSESVDNTSIKLFFLHPKPSRSPSKATPREEKGSRVQQPMRKSPAFSRSHKHTLSRTRTHTHSQTDRVLQT